jgi:cytochrome P450
LINSFTDAEQIEKEFAAQHGCKPLRPWSAKWPLGLDLLIKATQYAKKQQIMQLFLAVVEDSGCNTFEQNLLGTRGIDTQDPANLEALLSKQFTEFGLGLRPPTFYPLLGSGIFTQDGQQWKHTRELLRPQFMRNRSENFEQIKTCVQNLISVIPDDGIVDLQPLFFRLTFDTTTFLLFGKSMSALSSDAIAGQESEFADAFNTSQDYLSHRGRLGDLYWLMNDKTFRNACKTCHRFVDDAVQSTLEELSSLTEEEVRERSNYIFLNALIQETHEPKVLRDQCLNILLAGRDTTACCLSWTL